MLQRILSALLLTAALAAPSFADGARGAPSEPTSATPAVAAKVDVTVIHATPEGTMDRRLAPMARPLTRAFKAYKGFTWLDEQSSAVRVDDERKLTLPNGSELAYRFLGADPDGYLRVHIEVGGLRSTVRVKDGGTFFQAGRGYLDGMIVLVFKAAAAR